MAPERNKRLRDEEVLTRAQSVEKLLESSRRSRERRKLFNDPNNQKRRHLWMFHSNRCYPMSHQLQVQMTTLFDEGLLGRSFYDQFLVLPKEEWSLRFNQGIRNLVGRFISEGGVLVKDMKAHLGRWDPDLKAAAVSAKSFACIAQLICVDEMVELGNRLEVACLSGNDPIEIYGLSWRVMDFYSRANYKLDCLLFLANEALGVTSTPPPLPAHRIDGIHNHPAVEDYLRNYFLYDSTRLYVRRDSFSSFDRGKDDTSVASLPDLEAIV